MPLRCCAAIASPSDADDDSYYAAATRVCRPLSRYADCAVAMALFRRLLFGNFAFTPPLIDAGRE